MPENLPRFDGQVCTALHCNVLTTPRWERRSACAGSAAAALAAAGDSHAAGAGDSALAGWLAGWLLLAQQQTALHCAGAVVHLIRCSNARQPSLQPLFFAQPVNMGGILAWEFLLMHFVEVRRWQDIRKKDSVNAVSCTGGEVSVISLQGRGNFCHFIAGEGKFLSCYCATATGASVFAPA